MIFDPITWGFIFAALAALLLGSHDIPIKTSAIQKLEPDPMITQAYMNIAIFASCWLVLVFDFNERFSFDQWALISTSLCFTARILNIFATHNIGPVIAQGITAGVSVIVSFLWGVFVFDQTPSNIGYSVMAVIFLIAGLAGITISSSDLLEQFFSDDDVEVVGRAAESDKLLVHNSNYYGDRKRDNNMVSLNSWSSKSPEFGTKIFIGVLSAIATGLLIGTLFVPLLYSIDIAHPANITDLALVGQLFITSFGTSMLLATPIFAVPYFFVVVKCFEKKIELNYKLHLLAGMTSGFIWNIGFCLCVFSTLFLGISCGFPLSQTGIIATGLWGIILFKEITSSRGIALLIFSALIVLGGAVLLGFNRNKSIIAI